MVKNNKIQPTPSCFDLKLYSLVVHGIERTPIKPMICSPSKKYIKIDFISDELVKYWAFPSSRITMILYSAVLEEFYWFAIKIPPLPGKIPKKDCKFQIMFTIRADEEKLNQLFHFFNNSCTSAKISSVCPMKFCEIVGSYYENILLYDLFANDNIPRPNVAKILEKAKNNENNLEEVSVREDLDQDQIIVKFKDGQRKTVMHRYLVQSLEPRGWLCTSLMDIMLEYFLQEKLSQFPEWYNDVIFYDTMFFQKIFKYNTLLQTVSIDNYSQIMAELYPTKAGLYRGVPVFKKELLVIPVIIKKHWMIILVHKPMHALLDIDTEYSINLDTPKQRCRILIMDSKTGDDSTREILNGIHEEVFNCIKSWLYLMLFNIEEYPNTIEGCVKVICDKLPKQPNDDDCGVFALLFLEEFVLNNWTWTDLSYDKMSDICVEDIGEFYERALTYREFLSETVKELAVNLPQSEL